MAKYCDINSRMYFIFNHSEEYKAMHRNFIAMFPPAQPSTLLMYLDEARKRMHVEALLEASTNYNVKLVKSFSSLTFSCFT